MRTNVVAWVMPLLQPAAVFAIALAAMLVLRYLLLRWMTRKTAWHAAAIFAETVRFPSVLWALVAAMDISVRFATLTPPQIKLTHELIATFIIVSLTLVAASGLVRVIGAYGERQGMPFAMVGLSRALVRVLVFALGASALLAYFGKQITPIITALGVGGLAVALALQDTLANLFAGIHILMERPIFINDLIRLENGLEGVVTDIGWRTTRVRTGANDMVVVPNTKITSGVLVNYSLPELRSTVEMAILVAHEADAEQVCAIALEEAEQVEGVLREPAPLVLCDPGVLTTHLQLKLIVNVASRSQQGLVLSALRLRMLARFRAEGVPLPRAELARLPL
jgi:small-conductance mechanosensitive channel